MKITFRGAAREVTGSCYLIETGSSRFLVDCGMVQGGRDAPERNRTPFRFDSGSIDFVLLTHAHIDHSGLLPKLVRDGFKGPIHTTTTATADLLGVILPDSGHIQGFEAERARRQHKSTRDGAVREPIYTVQDAEDCLQQVSPIAYDNWLTPHAGVHCRFRDAGHILGSAIIEIELTEHGKTTTVVCSGDLGQPGRPSLRDPTLIEHADVLLIESTYGDRAHKDMPATLNELVGVIEHTLRSGNGIVPAFAVGRTREIIYHRHLLSRQGRLHNLSIFVDSPMATAATRITMRHLAMFDESTQGLAEWYQQGSGRPARCFIGGVDESIALTQMRAGAIIISASSMCNAGRIRHHLQHNLGRSECAVMFAGFQAKGTLGRRLADGAKRVTIFGQDIPVRAAVHTLGRFSAHADQSALLAWTAGFKQPPQRTFVVHGEETAALTAAQQLREQRGWKVKVPTARQSFEVTP
ncbi:MAG TPA: MBL fold metallo-hydrolase [Rhodanobacter sp.]|nr:MBL fold metallo-hydrolase [Rhodanobacter sp.]